MGTIALDCQRCLTDLLPSAIWHLCTFSIHIYSSSNILMPDFYKSVYGVLYPHFARIVIAKVYDIISSQVYIYSFKIMFYWREEKKIHSLSILKTTRYHYYINNDADVSDSYADKMCKKRMDFHSRQNGFSYHHNTTVKAYKLHWKFFQ